MIVIKKADIGDLKEIQNLNHELFVDHVKHDRFYNPNWPFEKVGEKDLKKALTNPKWAIFIALDEGKFIGFLKADVAAYPEYIGKMKIGEIKSLFVAEEYRSQGIGTRLIGEFKTWAKEKGAKRIFVDAEWANKEGIEFYKRNGFGECYLGLKIDY
jgi:GNAT superfamily N-acetyltransferase